MEENRENDNTPTEALNTILYPINKTIIERYIFAANFVKGKTVYDFPCGYGHGTKMFWALGATKAAGLDRSEEALAYANQNLTGSNVSFEQRDMCLPANLPPADVVVSLEGVEHVARQDFQKVLENFKSLCVPGGTIIISTPRRKTDVWEYGGGQHQYEYDFNELNDELRKVFTGNIKYYFALEFHIERLGPEECTIFTENPEHIDKAAVFIAVITNE